MEWKLHSCDKIGCFKSRPKRIQLLQVERNIYVKSNEQKKRTLFSRIAMRKNKSYRFSENFIQTRRIRRPNFCDAIDQQRRVYNKTFISIVNDDHDDDWIYLRKLTLWGRDERFMAPVAARFPFVKRVHKVH